VAASAGQDQPSWTIGSLLDWTAAFLLKKGAESPRLDAEVLLAHALGCRRIELYTRHAEPATEAVREGYRELIRRRTEGCPVAYLVGQKEFFSLTFEVDGSVLIPRPDSEHVVLECLRLAKGMPTPAILDLGVGSGNLSVALAFQLKTAKVVGVDISPAALAVATRNAVKHGVDRRVDFREGDLFGPIQPGEQFDFVVSNPPYIPTADVPGLEAGVSRFEPGQALDGGPDGFAVFDRIVGGALAVLKPGGSLIIEIGAPQHEEARRKIAALPQYELFDTIYDGSRHPRVLRARKRGLHSEE
jgi:release factor glutamine methyltransferase